MKQVKVTAVLDRQPGDVGCADGWVFTPGCVTLAKHLVSLHFGFPVCEGGDGSSAQLAERRTV